MSQLPKTPEGYADFLAEIDLLPEGDKLHCWWILSRIDLYFLLRYVLLLGDKRDKLTGKPVWENQFTLERCREVQAWNHNVLDIWSRYHGKSTIKTVALTIQDLLIDAEETIGIFSHNRHTAKSFGRTIRSELENNELLKSLSWNFDRQVRTFWDNPRKDAPTWSLDEGFVVNRRYESPTASIECWGLVDSHPTGKHFSICCYDDLVTKESVATPGQINKVNESWEESLNLGMPESGIFRYTGTFWAYGDSYHHLIRRGITPRLRPCYEVKQIEYQGDTLIPLKIEVDEDKPVAYSKEFLEDQKLKQGPRAWTAQMLCNPVDSLVTGFARDDLKTYENAPSVEAEGKNLYILYDAANEKKKGSDFTVFWVVAVGSDRNLYVVDGVRDRLALHERGNALFSLHRQWSQVSRSPIEVRIERYGIMADGQHFEYMMEVEKYRFHLVEVGGIVKKEDRIKQLQPLFSDRRIYLPESLKKTRLDGTDYDMVQEFVDQEYMPWPHSKTDDMLDCLARIAEPKHPLIYPSGEHPISRENETRNQFYDRLGEHADPTSWMAW